MPPLCPTRWLEPLTAQITVGRFDPLARATGFLRRRPKKVTPAGFLLTACLFALQTHGSLAGFARLWAFLHRQTLSKQAVHRRCTNAAVDFLQAVLQRVLASLVQPACLPSPLRGAFKRILLHDSTCLSLPLKLIALFPAGTNQHHRPQAGLRLQATLDLLKNQWVAFRFHPQTVNDQKTAPDILEIVQKGDLLIRDLGYLVLEVLQQIQQKGAYFLSRWRYGLKVFAAPTGEPIALLAQLQQSGPVWDAEVWLGREKLPARLIAVRLPEAVANERRRRARRHHDRCTNHSPEYYQLLGWNILITNVPQSLLAAASLVELYSLRWRIEIVFKAWKSHFHLSQLTDVALPQLQILLLGKLLWICWFSVHWTQLAAQGIQVSLLKLAQWWSQFALALFQPPQKLPPQTLWDQLSYYCCYDKRRDRRNFLQKCATLC
jgi:hypothetical protein